MVERYTALAAEVNKPIYVGQTDAQIQTALTVKNVAIKAPVSGDTLRLTVMLRAPSVWDKLIDAATAHAQPNVKTAAIGFVDAVKLLNEWTLNIPADYAAFSARLDTFVNAVPQVITPAQRNTALALADSFTCIADRDGFPDPTLSEIANARTGG